MKNAKAWLLTAATAAAMTVQTPDVHACGGCFIAQSESTLVTGHKMILSISQQQTTLYDQIVYDGEPSSFAWILPVKGVATIGLSSDALFQALDDQTTISISSPTISCSPPPFCGGDDFAGAGGGSYTTTASTTTGTGVTVVAQQTVGPYEIVQLHSSDPNALNTWLTAPEHGYTIPADLEPVVSAYVNEGFDFLAMKLVPGQGVNAMRPVRVTTSGASPVLPLRMVAAGTGAITPITLWIMAEGRYEPTNMPSFEIAPSELVWNWDTQASNYSALRQEGFADTNNAGWLVQAGEPYSKYGLTNTLVNAAKWDPENSGYGDELGMGAEQEAMDDLETLFGTIPDNNLWVTRINGEIARAALATDLTIGAAAAQSQVERYFYVQNTTGTPPSCPTYPPCPPDKNGGQGWEFWGSEPGAGPAAGSSGGCAMTSGGGVPMLSGIALLAALAFARRRRVR